MNPKLVFSILTVVLSLVGTTSVLAQSDPNQKSTPAELVDALNGVFGKQTDNRGAC
jgi:hypothetical protein